MTSEKPDFQAIVETQLRELHEVVKASEGKAAPVVEMAREIVAALKAGRKVLTAGNGGSASDALHMSEELIGRYRTNRVALPAIALPADATALTCIGNDFGFDHIFSRQVEALGEKGDILVVFSTSGNSENLLTAAAAAKQKGVKILALTGKSGGKLAAVCDIAWIVPSQNTARIQELHTWAMHSILECVELSFPAV
jgi:D-sedoheptulose 7-phosphate isomerase